MRGVLVGNEAKETKIQKYRQQKGEAKNGITYKKAA